VPLQRGWNCTRQEPARKSGHLVFFDGLGPAVFIYRGRGFAKPRSSPSGGFSMRSISPLLIVVAAVLAIPSVASADPHAITGIPNFHQVTNRIFRGGQPEVSESWTQLSKLGVKTVLDLRRPGEHSTTAESIAVSAAGMRYVNFPMNGLDTPTVERLAGALALLNGTDPIFVHCKQGRDRTGTVIAAYRICHQGWENRKALAEAQSLGLHWYENGMKKFIVACPVAAPPAAPASQPLADAKTPAPDSTHTNRGH
jgi:tyrosine-protein phosphatase SIW14